MNTEKIEKLKKSLSNSKIPADLKPKIEAEIKRLESLDDLANEKAKEEKEEAKEEAKPVAKTRKPRAKKTTTAKPSQTSKPKRTAMSLAKEIRKEGESWKEAQARASKMMKEGSKEVTKTVETELDKLSKLVKSKKELRSQIGRTNLLIDAKRKAKPMGRRISKDGNVYYENRANRTDRGTYGKYHLATGGYLTDPNFGGFQNNPMFNNGGEVGQMNTVKQYWNSFDNKKRINFLVSAGYSESVAKDLSYESWDSLEEGVHKNLLAVIMLKGGSVTNERRYVNKGEDYEVRYSKPILRRKGYQGKRDFELGGVMATDLAGHTGGGDAGFNAGMPLDGFSNTAYTGLVGETGAMSSGEMFMAGGSVGNFDVKLLVGKRVVYEAKVDTLKKAQRIGSEILSWGDDKFEYTIIGYDSSNNKIFENKRLLSDEFPDRLKDKFATLKLNVIVANPKQNKLDAGSFTTYRALLNIVDDFEEANFRVTINGKTFYDDYEHGGGLPHGAEQSYMITEALGNPAQHYARGGGVRRVGNREYSYGRNWTNDHRHVNKGEDHEVKYTRKRNFLGIFDDGGSVNSMSELDAEMMLKDLKKNGQISQLSVGNHGLIFMSIKDGQLKSYQSYKDAYSHYLKSKYAYGGMTNLTIQDVSFATGGAIKNQYAGRTPEDIWDSLSVEQRKHFVDDHFRYLGTNMYKYFVKVAKENRPYKSLPTNLKLVFDYHISEGQYNKGGAVTNERLHVNHDEDYEVRYAKPRPSRKGYKGVRSFANGGGVENKYNSMSKEDKEELMREKIGIGRTPFSEYEKYNQLSPYHKELVDKHFSSKKMYTGGSMETPRIYVADLEAYNNGRLVGEWLDLSDYNDADELMDAIQDVLKKSGGEEYAIHDVENVPSSMYSEYMGRRDFEELYEMMELADRNDLPLSVVSTVVSEYGADAVDEFVGKYDSADDFAQEMVDDLGIESFTDFERYLIISETDRRLLAQEMADSYVDDIRDEDGGNRLIEEAGMDVSEYEEADSEIQEEMLDKAREIVYDEYYDTWYDGLNDPYYFLVEEQGMYSADDFANANFVQVDYEALAEALEYDYAFVYSDGDLYVFNIR